MKDKDYIKLMKMKEQIRKRNNYIHYLKRKVSRLEEQLECAYEAVDHWNEEYEKADSKEKALRTKLYEILKANEFPESANDSELPF